tara:strand:- start:169 stop:798 length:630 start_codon:yes stop_codon:yes gene_type:complete
MFVKLRILFYPIRKLINFLQNFSIKYFNFMDLGATQSNDWKEFIKNNIIHKSFTLDFGCGTGNFSNLFNNKRYLGVDINSSFINYANKKNKEYEYCNVKDSKLFQNYEKNIDQVLINGVLHHLSDQDIKKSFDLIIRLAKKHTNVLIIEPTIPKKILTLEYLIKILDLGNHIRTKDDYVSILKQHIVIEIIDNYKFSYEKGIYIKGKLK